ncbi:hypothetical protein M378DRAFT_21478 [Amanita muscaria Koide BX008]|uniref:CID domain-containing protein n=1 Tax=Amanita muscaria (strain Koide BX008) TaxID=946122 RepID=A0A0C2XJN4_AMAMK|nr:hypothetical protein M378DRAFT_21478 [Amanita muscaria Koide BX008]
MASVDVFEATLKEAVQAKRLSARKMTELTEMAMKLMEHDTQLVSILYRTHKTLPPTFKVSSLYVFDALARAARHQVAKHNLTGSIYSEKGNCATFLLKVEGVLEGLFQDMMLTGTEESKEKSRKILDIWVKGNTFPSPIMSRLTKLVKEPEKVIEAEQAFPTASNVTAPVPDTQAALLALLTQAASATIPTSEQIPTNTIPPAPPSVDAVQLALLQQLAQKAISAPITNAVPPRPSTDSPIPPFSPTGDRPPSPSSSRDSHRDDSRRSTERDRYRSRSPDRASTSEGYPDHRRGNFRGAFRGRGRGDPRGRWDDNDRFRDRERDRRRGVRSRSKSPTSRYPSRRDMRPYSPPGRQPTTAFQRRVDSPGTSRSDGKDEFGRDIRAQSPENMDPSPDIPTYPTGSRSLSVHDPVIVSSPASQNNEQVTISPLVAANTSSNNSSAPFVSNTVQPQLGLDSYDPTSFNPTSPSSWELLGKMWQVTYGEMPTTEQLMQYVMHAMAGGQAPSASTVSPEVQGPAWGNSSGHGQLGGRGRGGFPARGGSNGYGNNHNLWDRYDDNQTDAIVLGSSENDAEQQIDNQPAATQEISKSSPGGKMQKVGDRWVFVRDIEVAL